MRDIYVAPKETDQAVKKPIKKMAVKPAAKGKFFSQLRTAFLAFADSPQDIRFETQEDGEDVLLLLRRHWITNVPWIIISVLAFLAPAIIFPVLSFLKIFAFLPLSYQTILLIVWYTLTFSFVLISFINWYFNVFIITNYRIIDVDFYNLLYKEVSSSQLSKIQDVTFQVGGTLKIFFDFGNVFVQTAAEEENIEFESVPKPALVVRKINELLGKNVPATP